MSIFKRLKDITLSNINALIDKAEDPVKMTDQYLRDMSEDIKDAEAAVVKQIALVKRLKNQIDEAQAMVTKRSEQALAAMEKGDENLARRALEDKKVHQGNVDSLTPQYEANNASAERLKAQLQEMKDEYQKLQNTRNTLVARAEAAKAQKSINKAMSSFDADGAKTGINRMMDKVAQAEAEAQAGLELRSSSSNLDADLAKLDSGIEDELAALRAQVAAKQGG